MTKRGRTLHRLVATESYKPNIARMLELSRFDTRPDSLEFELVVTDEGVPVSATFRCVVQQGGMGGEPGFVGTAEYEFDDFGAAYRIRAP
jgi:hypothetical protein